jgi:hypothetical protein
LVVAEHRSEVGHEFTVASQVVLLVVVLGEVEGLERLDAGCELATASGLEALGDAARRSQLGVVVNEHERGVLAFESGPERIVRGQREGDQLLVAHNLGIEVDLEALGVVSDAVIRGIARLAAGVADARPPDSFDDPKLGVRRPESTDGEGRRLQMGRDQRVDRRARKRPSRRVVCREEAQHGKLLLWGVRIRLY